MEVGVQAGARACGMCMRIAGCATQDGGLNNAVPMHGIKQSHVCAAAGISPS